MKILIQQTLHGYHNGHQLLNSSLDLSAEERKILLFQSDLSGSNFDENFKSYITGYPLNGNRYYALARTWYANEMKRPGCVWTHTLLIALADLGKIPELSCLNSLFIRPVQDEYNFYENPLELDISKISEPLKITKSNEGIKRKIIIALYEFPDLTVLVPSLNAEKIESIIFNIWSDQWPRMRRNFAFCSGALGLKLIEEREFDLQVIPETRTNNISRQSKSPIISESITKSKFSWEQIQLYPKNKLRKFVWSYGADISGERKNYIPLLEMFVQLNSDTPSLTLIEKYLNKYFPGKKIAKSLKTKLFDENSLLLPSITEKEILKYLITSSELTFLSVDELGIEKRLEKLLLSKEMKVPEFLNLWKHAQPYRLNHTIWDIINLSSEETINLLKNDENLIEILLDKVPEISEKEQLWALDYNIQLKIFNTLLNNNLIIDWEKVVIAVLNAESKIVFDIEKKLGNQVVVYSLNWLNRSSNPLCLISYWSSSIVKDHYEIFFKWVHQNKRGLHPKIFALIFIYCSPARISEFKLSGDAWIDGYNNLKQNNYCVSLSYLSCLLLGLAFEKKLPNSEGIVVATFYDVYNYSAASKIDSTIWPLIPIEQIHDEEEEIGFFENFFSLLGFGQPKKGHEVESWDYCEQLTRSLVNKFIKFEWSTQSFLNTLNSEIIFLRTIQYSLSFKKGQRLVRKILFDIDNGKTIPLKFQNKILNKYYNK